MRRDAALTGAAFAIVAALLVLLARHLPAAVEQPGWVILVGVGFSLFLAVEFLVGGTQYSVAKDHGYTPRISVLLPVRNEERVIESSIRSVRASHYPEALLEIIVIDDASYDRTPLILRRLAGKLDVRIVTLPTNMGKRKALAEGFAYCRGDIVLAMDSDTLLAPDAIYNGVQHLHDPEVGAVCGHGKVLNWNENWLTRMQETWYDGMFSVFKAYESVFGMVTCCSGIFAMYRRTLVAPMVRAWAEERFLGTDVKVGDDRALTNLVLGLPLVNAADADDRMLTNAVIRRTKVVYARNALAYTEVPADWRKFIRQQVRWKKGWFRGNMVAATFMWRKHPVGAGMYYLYLVLSLLTPIVVARMIIVPLVTMDPWRFLHYGAGIAFVACCYGVIYAMRRTHGIWHYRVAFQLTLNLFVLPFLSVYAWLTLREESWMTR